MATEAVPQPSPAAAVAVPSRAAPPATAARRAPAAAPARRPVLRQYELVERVKAYDPNADEDLLNRAYVFAMKAHGSQLRASGDPYFHHPVEVAGILTAYKLDSASIATGLLHDVIEDTGATLAEIERLFGPQVARLVDGVTKLTRLPLQSAQTAQAENFRKLLLAMSDDIRVLLIKLADRLHNMRTLHFIDDPARRRRIASETMEIYAPLAERIGMAEMQAELADLAFAELMPDARESILHRLRQLRRDDDGLVERIVEQLRGTLARAGIAAEITGREKTPLSIWRKMQRKNVSFEQLADIIAFRVVVGSVADCYAALGVVHGAYAMMPGRFKDFISTPKPNGYRSLHTTIFGPERRKIEVQIRTAEMDEVCEFGVAAHWAYKQGAPSHEGRQYRWIRELLDILEHTAGPEEFLENTKLEMFQDQVFCFTPKGDIIALPRGATPIDFAYAVHSEVGDHCVGARVDGRMVQLRYALQNGDQVEIITSKNAAPSAAWERIVVTGKARARIRRYLRSRKREEFIQQGRDQLQRAAKAEGFQLGERLLERVVATLPHRTVDDLLAAVGEGSTAVRLVIEACRAELGQEEPERPSAKIVPLRRRGEPTRDTLSPIAGLPPGIAFQFAGCCHPVRGEPIVGLIRTGRPVTIHATHCPTLQRAADAADSSIDLSWDVRATEVRTAARLAVMALNKPGALGAVSTVIGKQGGNIVDVRFGHRAPDLYEIFLDVEVDGLDQLQRVLGALRASGSVSSVERVYA